MKCSLPAVFVALAVCACASLRGGSEALNLPSEPVPSVFAPAPLWMRSELLGTPLDAHFQPLQSAGTSIFPEAPIAQIHADDFKHEKIEIRDTTTLDANISAWAALIGVKAGMGTTTDYRFASFRAYDIHLVSALDDRFPHAAPPPGAVWYPARIYWGHSYEVVCYGHANNFTTNVAARFEVVSGGISNLNGQSGVSCQLTGRGLQPKKSGALFAGSDPELRAFYDDVGATPSPVFVEYRLVPGLRPPASSAIEWQTPYSVEVRFNSVTIDFQGNWLNVGYFAQGVCSRNGQQIFGPSPVLTGDKGTTGTVLTANWLAGLTAMKGDRISCGLQGRFVGALVSGALPNGAVSPELQIVGPGAYSSSFIGTNADTHYRVNYTLTVSTAR